MEAKLVELPKVEWKDRTITLTVQSRKEALILWHIANTSVTKVQEDLANSYQGSTGYVPKYLEISVEDVHSVVASIWQSADNILSEDNAKNND